MKKYTTPIALARLLADGEYHSGEKLGEIFGISRAAINKHIRTLKQLGLDMETTTGKGYRIRTPLKLLDHERITKYLIGSKVHLHTILDSTNQFIMENMGLFSPGDICLTECQYSGRGRNGTSWHSPFGRNIYMSMYWRLDTRKVTGQGLNLVVCVIVAEVLQAVGVKNLKLKWPNDIYLNKKRLAGVLVESQGKDFTSHIVIGVGINIAMDLSGSEENVIDQSWINLNNRGAKIDRNFLVIEIAKKLVSGMTELEKNGLSSFLERWRRLDDLLNRKVKLTIQGKQIMGISRGITPEGDIIIEKAGRLANYPDNYASKSRRRKIQSGG